MGIKDSPAKKVVTIYPNPTSDLINIKLYTDRKYFTSELQIIDLNGKMIMEKQIQLKALIPETINISDLNAGLYFLIFTLDNNKQYLKLIKQ